MTKQASAPPTPGKGAPVAPPPPPPWRHYLWAIAFLIFIGLYFVLPATEIKGPVTLNYTQFLSDVSGHKVKTVTLATNGSASGTLSNGNTYTTAVPPKPARPCSPSWRPTRSRSRRETTGTASGPRSCPGSSCCSRSSSSATSGGGCPSGRRRAACKGCWGGALQSQGLRPGAAQDHVRRRGRLRRGQGRSARWSIS